MQILKLNQDFCFLNLGRIGQFGPSLSLLFSGVGCHAQLHCHGIGLSDPAPIPLPRRGVAGLTQVPKEL